MALEQLDRSVAGLRKYAIAVAFFVIFNSILSREI